MNSFLEHSDFLKSNSAAALLKQYGSPLYVYNEEILRKQMHAVTQVITKYPYTANYSIKANTNINILKIALEEGVNCDAMSTGEIQMLLKAGYPSEKIFFVPNNVSEEELQFALEHNIITSLDSLSQLERFGALCSKLNTAPENKKCAVRINPGVGAGHCEKVITAGKKTKFGIQEADIPQIFTIAEKYGIRIAGINQHIGSLFMDPQPYLDAVTNLLRIAMQFPKLDFIDFGGGYGTPYHKLSDEAEFPMEEFKKRLEPIIDTFVSDYTSTKNGGSDQNKIPLFKSEPGRYCVAEGSVILGTVHAVKQNSGKTYIGTDVGMNVLIRPSMYDSWHDIEFIRDDKPLSRDTLTEQTVCGNICESGDLLAKDRPLPPARENDIICVLDTGAYGYSMCYPYNSRPRPAEVLITKEGTVKQIRRRETIDDLMSLF